MNSILALVTNLERPIGARAFADAGERLKWGMRSLTTSLIAPLLPDLAEDYGENQGVDIKVFFSKAKFLEELPKSKPTSITFDKNGLCKV